MKKLLAVLLALTPQIAAAAPLALNEKVLAASVSRAMSPLLMQLTGMYAEDTPHVSGHFGHLVLAVRNDSGSVLAGTTGDYIPFTTDNTGALRVTGSASGGLTDTELRATPVPVSGTVTVTDGAGALNTIVDSGTITAVTTITNPVTVTDGAGALNTIVDSSALPSGASTSAKQDTEIASLGTIAGAVAGTEMQVDVLTMPTTTVTDGSGALNVIVDSSALPSGAATAALQDGIIKDGTGDTTQANVASGRLAVDPGTVTVTDGSGAMNVIVDSSASIAVTGPLTDTQLRATPVPVSGTVTVTDGAGALNVIADSGTITTVSTVTSVTQNPDVRQATASNLNVQAVGSIASDSADSGNPVKIGGKAFSYGTGPTAVTANDRVDAAYTRDGAQWVMVGSPASTSVEYLWTTAQTNDAVITVSSGTRIVVTGYQVQISSPTTVSTTVRCGFGTATLTTAPTDGNTAVSTFLSVDLVPGSGANGPPGMLVAGADDEDVRCTTSATTGGTGRLFVFYATTAN